jgi:hypothetical protein
MPLTGKPSFLLRVHQSPGQLETPAAAAASPNPPFTGMMAPGPYPHRADAFPGQTPPAMAQQRQQADHQHFSQQQHWSQFLQPLSPEQYPPQTPAPWHHPPQTPSPEMPQSPSMLILEGDFPIQLDLQL